MRSFKSLALCALLALSSPFVAAQNNTYTYSGLNWAFSTSQAGFSGCDTLILDATGDVYNSNYYSTYGRLSCSALGGSYASFGSAYFDSFGTFNITVTLSVTHQMVCNGLSASTFSGSCPIYSNQGTQTGTAFISFL